MITLDDLILARLTHVPYEGSAEEKFALFQESKRKPIWFEHLACGTDIRRQGPQKSTGVGLIDRALGDASVPWVLRPTDSSWSRRMLAPRHNSGFNPFLEAIYLSPTGAVASWIVGDLSIEAGNINDSLVQELAVLSHDWLHVCSYRWMHEMARWTVDGRHFVFGETPITAESLEDYVFCHVMSEAVATVGGDFWGLNQLDLTAFFPGTAQTGFSTSYHARDREHFLSFAPGLQVEHPAFFERLATSYALGFLDGASFDDVKRNPRVLHIVAKELGYGKAQRVYAWDWFSAFAGVERRPEATDLLTVSPHHAALISSLAAALWTDAFEGGFETRAVGFEIGRHLPGPIDFRFTNLETLSVEEIVAAARSPASSSTSLLMQLVSGIRHDFLKEKVVADLVRHIAANRSDESVLRAILDYPRIRDGWTGTDVVSLFFPT